MCMLFSSRSLSVAWDGFRILLFFLPYMLTTCIFIFHFHMCIQWNWVKTINHFESGLCTSAQHVLTEAKCLKAIFPFLFHCSSLKAIKVMFLRCCEDRGFKSLSTANLWKLRHKAHKNSLSTPSKITNSKSKLLFETSP